MASWEGADRWLTVLPCSTGTSRVPRREGAASQPGWGGKRVRKGLLDLRRWGLALTRSRRVCAFVWQRYLPMCVGVYLGPGECDFSGSDSTPGRPLEMRCLRLLCRPPAPGSAFSQDAGEVHVHIQVQVCLLHTGRRAPCRSRRRAVLRRLVNTRAWRDSDTNSCVLPGTGVHAQSPC